MKNHLTFFLQDSGFSFLAERGNRFIHVYQARTRSSGAIYIGVPFVTDG